MIRIQLAVLIASAVLVSSVQGNAQVGTGAPPRDMAAALTPGARIRVSGRQLDAEYVGIVVQRRGDSLTVWTEGFRGVDGKELNISLADSNRLHVSGGYEPGPRTLVAKFMLAGAILAAIETSAFGADIPISIYAMRSGAAALLFALFAPHPAPRERWVVVTERPQG